MNQKDLERMTLLAQRLKTGYPYYSKNIILGYQRELASLQEKQEEIKYLKSRIKFLEVHSSQPELVYVMRKQLVKLLLPSLDKEPTKLKRIMYYKGS